MDAGNLTEVNKLKAKELRPIEVTESGIVTEVSRLPAKARSAIEVTGLPPIVVGMTRSVGHAAKQPVTVTLLLESMSLVKVESPTRTGTPLHVLPHPVEPDRTSKFCRPDWPINTPYPACGAFPVKITLDREFSSKAESAIVRTDEGTTRRVSELLRKAESPIVVIELGRSNDVRLLCENASA